MVVRELITKLGFWFNEGQAARAEKRTQMLKDQANQASNAFRNLVLAVASLATIRAVVQITDEMQSMRTRIGMLPQTIGDASDAFDTVAERASAAGMSIDAYGKLYTRVGNAAKDYVKTQEDLLTITDTISKALVVGGASTQESNAAMIQFSQALASGVLQGDEFRSMAEAAPQYLDKLSETMKIPREQLKKMASEGKLTARAVIEATRQMSGYFSDKFNQMPMTVGRAVTLIGNRFSLMLDRMNRDSGFINTISRALLTAFGAIENGINKVVDAFDGWANAIRYLGIVLGVALGAKTLAILYAFGIAGLKAMLPWVLIASAILVVAALVEDLYLWIQGGDSLVGSLLGPWEEWAPYVMAAVEMVVDAFKWLMEIVGHSITMWKGLFKLDLDLFLAGLAGMGEMLYKKLAEWGTALYNAFFTPIMNALNAAWDAVTGRIAGIWEAAKSLVGLGTPTPATGPGIGALTAVTPGQLADPGSRPNISSTTQVNVTVPPGTTAEQAAFLERTAQKSFAPRTDAQLANTLSVYAP